MTFDAIVDPWSGCLRLNAENGVGLSGVDLAESLELHVAVLGLPLIVLLEQHRADRTCGRCLVWEYPVFCVGA